MKNIVQLMLVYRFRIGMETCIFNMNGCGRSMIYYADWCQLEDGAWVDELPFPDDYEFQSLMEILTANPKLWMATDEARC